MPHAGLEPYAGLEPHAGNEPPIRGASHMGVAPDVDTDSSGETGQHEMRERASAEHPRSATAERRRAALEVELTRSRWEHDALMFELGLRDALDGDDETFRMAVDEISAQERIIAAAQAKRAELLAFAHDATVGSARTRHPGDDDALVWAMRERTSELAVATSQPEARIRSELADAVVLHESFPETANDFHSGSLSLAHVRAITGPGARIPTRRTRVEYQRALLGPARHLTPARLRARAAQLAEHLLPETIDQRHAHAASARGVHVRHEHDGMSRLEADLPTVLAAAIHNRLTAQARALAGPDEPRTRHQLRADVFSELLLTSDLTGTGSPHAAAAGIAARISITVPVLSLLDHTPTPGLLDGLTPVPLEQARSLTAHAPSWLRVLTDPITGTTLEADTRHPTAAQRALLHARDHHCRFPGCTRPAPQCDIDHTVAVAHGGPTRIDNLECLCRPHHTLKHHTRWRVRQDAGGHLDWTSPTGHTYTDRPTPTITRATSTVEADGSPRSTPPGPASSSPPLPSSTSTGPPPESHSKSRGPHPSAPPGTSPPATDERPGAWDRSASAVADPGPGTRRSAGPHGGTAAPKAPRHREPSAGPRFEPTEEPPPF